MVFSSLEFILIFLPIFFLFYYAVPSRWRNAILLAGSLCFYFVGTASHAEHFILFLVSIAVDFSVGLLLEKSAAHKKAILTAGIVFHLLCLCSVKYFNFFVGELSKCIEGFDPVIQIVLPIGISFYTFQGISYIVDVYRGKVKAEKSLLNFAVYISMFEQLIAGPIVTYDRVSRDLPCREIKLQDAFKGFGTFVFGLGLKVLLANPTGKLWNQVEAIGFESISTPLAWMALLAFSFQIYFDFFGYSLMAVGLGRMLGFKLPKNFDHPYLSRSMTEFWRRWHITLGSWFREYVYIPLGGNRKGSLMTVRNLLIIWLLTGMWHGAGYNFILWGFVIFVVIAMEKLFLGKLLEKAPKAVGHIYMVLLIMLTWAIFAIDDMSELGVFFSRLFPLFGGGFWSVFRYDYLKYLKMYFPFFIAGFLFSTKLPYNMLKKIKKFWPIVLIIAAIFAGSVYCMCRGYDDPFLYFRF
ncbi:MAG: MBOAT family protein [Oscillospiraceae bacterium]|nr:MBOAT family protein [Oscillospiraceae bacterium]